MTIELRNTVTVKRLNGAIETVDITERFPGGLTPELARKMRNALIEAGKAVDLISYANAKADADRDNREVRLTHRQAFDNLYNEGSEGYNPHR